MFNLFFVALLGNVIRLTVSQQSSYLGKNILQSSQSLGPCPINPTIIAENRNNPNCRSARTRFCYKSKCRRCCVHTNSCNPDPSLLVNREKCKNELCRSIKCKYPGEYCDLTKDNLPKCHCPVSCPEGQPARVCGSDGITYSDECHLNKTACMLGLQISVTFQGSCNLQSRYLFVSPLHQSSAILEANQPGKLKCTFLGSPLSITWSKLEMDSLPTRMIPITETLVIPKVRIADEGTYRCEAYNGLSSVEAFVKVTVEYNTEKINLDYSKRSKASCLLTRRYGYCSQHDVRWYFDAKTRLCQPFVYSGCGGNENNFQTLKQCRSACGHWAGNICDLPKESGPCEAHITSWYYDKDKQKCRRFVYGGCRGNANRFLSEVACEAKCKAQKGSLSPCIKLYMNVVKSHRRGLFTPRCTADGHFQETQCHQSVCFCMDENGLEMQGTRVPNGQYINCTKTAIRRCREERKHMKHNLFSGQHIPQCKSDGSYENVQCSPRTGHCWCVDTAGQELIGTRTREPLVCPSLDGILTSCQTQYIENAKSQHQEFVTQCGPDGRYLPVLCSHGGNATCSCVDEETGEVQRGTEISVTIGVPQCKVQGSLTLCQRMHQEATRHPDMTKYVPQCTEDGQFEHVQCDPTTKACWCVDRRGMEVVGSKTQGNIICPDLDSKLSPCQRRYQYAIKRLSFRITHHAPRCKADGRYDDVQCYGQVCYCVDSNGVEATGTRVDAVGRKPNCTNPDSNVTPCEQARYLAMKRNTFVPRCKPDGSWQTIQCEHSTGLCWCINDNGQEIKGTRTRRQIECDQRVPRQKRNPKGNCWTEYLSALRSSRRSRRLPWCLTNGDYNLMQCHGSFCYCVTKDGTDVPGTKLSIFAGKPNCQNTVDSLTQCQLQYQGAMASGIFGGHVPRCKSDGHYEEVQCQSGTSVCWCVDENGKELPGTRSNKEIKCPVVGRTLSPCKQQYLVYARKPSSDRLKPRCTMGGDFEPVQCKGLFCFCVNKNGREIPGTRLTRQTGMPVCNRNLNRYLTPCQRQVHKAHAQQKVPPGQIVGPRCKHDGNYEEVQCSHVTGQCWCVDGLGREVAKTRTNGYIKCPSVGHVLTPCQKEYQSVLRHSLVPNRVPQCTMDGRYSPVQCHGDYCYCVNTYGVEIANTRRAITDDRPNCQSIDPGLTLCQRQRQKYMRNEDHRQLEPSCNADGSYRDVQCYGSQCYCVDQRGVEVLGTRQNFIDGKPNCQKKYLSLTPCQQYLQEAISNTSNATDHFVARCNKDGQFEPLQCDHLTGKCWCVDSNGKEIKNTRTKGIPQCIGIDPSTQCWRDYITTSLSTLPGSFTSQCTKKGDYEPLQVQASRYFCVNDLGHEVLGTRVSVMEPQPNCVASASPGFIPSPCQREQIRQVYSPRTSRNYTPRCKTDGTYDEIQCDTSQGQCWCVDKDGQELDGLRTAGLLICPSDAPLTRCQSQREKALQALSMDSSITLYIPGCTSDGGFNAVQCHGLSGQCWCVDVNGIEIPGTVVFARKPDCDQAAKMTSCQRSRIVAMGMTGKPGSSRYVPQCTHDGRYQKVQCHSGTGLCWCVNNKGHEIIGTRMWGHPECEDITSDESTDHPLDIAILYPPPTDQTTLKSLKTFLRSVVHSFDAISRETHYSFTVFSEKTSSPLLFNGLEGRKYTKENVNKMIDKIQKDSSVARVDRGIQYADQEIFTLINGMRTAAHKVLVVLMDKKQTRNQGRHMPLSIVSEDLKSTNVHIYSIGISDQIALDELMDMASSPVDVFTVDDYKQLAKYGQEIVPVINNDTRGAFKVEKLCNLAMEPGKRGCLAKIPVWYYNSLTGQCLQFTYSGCGGNSNNFATYEKCRQTCGGILPMCYEVKRKRTIKYLDHYRPSCGPRGDYAAIQCYAEYCWCVDKDGAETPNTRVQGTPVCSQLEGKTTDCLEERRQALGRLGVPSVGRHAPECDTSGNYRTVQTNGNSDFRWCVDPAGYPVRGTQRWGKLNCTHEVMNRLRASEKVTAKTQCEKERIKSELLDNAQRLFTPRCNQDGGYEQVQCHGRVCWCDDGHGNEIVGTRQRGTPNCTQVASLSICRREYKRSMILRGVTPLGYFLPQCTEHGQFEPIQCHSATGFCWCVDRSGNELVNTRQWGRPNCTMVSEQTECQARREECQENQPASHFVPACKDDGGFEDLQCLDSMGECWCVDHYGYELAGTRTSLARRPNCQLLAWLSPCQIKRREALGPDGLPVVGLFLPECKPDGSFEPVQCHHHDNGNMICWCVDSQGVEVVGSRQPPGVRPYCDKTPLCLELQKQYSSSNTSRVIPQCNLNGGFASIQCTHSKDFPSLCWCVDDYGNEIYNTMSSKKLNCSASGLTVCQHGYNQGLSQGSAVVPRCTVDGSFAPMQCNTRTNQCWCVDRYNVEIPGSRRQGQVTCESREEKRMCILARDAGPCQSRLTRWYYDSKTKLCTAFMYGGCAGNKNRFIDYSSCQEQCQGTPLTSCQQQLSMSKVLNNQHTPSCDVDGSYKLVQCNPVTKQCWCVNNDGNEIMGYRTTNNKMPRCPGDKQEPPTTASPIEGRKWRSL